MPALRKPYSFETFDAPSEDPAPETTAPADIVYSQEDLDAACAEVRKETLADIQTQHLASQTMHLKAIVDALEIQTHSVDQAIRSYRDEITEAAKAFCEAYGVSSAAQESVDAALDILKTYLDRTDDAAPATLYLSEKADQSALDAIKTELKARNAHKQISVAVDTELKPGDIRLAWRDGALRRSHNDMRDQIEQHFNALSASRSFRNKEKKS
ncbi:MAG: hypothetical protein AAGD92_04595 [Pseudomonadota bacterium]